MQVQMEIDRKIDRIRQSLQDLNSLEAAPRLNAQVRLREEHVEMLGFLLEQWEIEWNRRNEAAVQDLLNRNPYHW
jgi:hypothetical protein